MDKEKKIVDKAKMDLSFACNSQKCSDEKLKSSLEWPRKFIQNMVQQFTSPPSHSRINKLPISTILWMTPIHSKQI